jgi:hypothetical protein
VRLIIPRSWVRSPPALLQLLLHSPTSTYSPTDEFWDYSWSKKYDVTIIDVVKESTRCPSQ